MFGLLHAPLAKIPHGENYRNKCLDKGMVEEKYYLHGNLIKSKVEEGKSVTVESWPYQFHLSTVHDQFFL